MQSQADRKRRGTLVDYNILDTAQSASPDTPIDHSGVLPTPLLLFFLEQSAWGLTHSISQSEATVMFREDISSQNIPRTKATARNLRYTLEASSLKLDGACGNNFPMCTFKPSTQQDNPHPNCCNSLQRPSFKLDHSVAPDAFTHTHTHSA